MVLAGLVLLGQFIIRLYDDKGKQIGEMKLPDNVKGVGVQPPGGQEVKVAAGPGKQGPPAGAWEPGPAVDVLPGIVPRPAKLPGLGRWQVVTARPRAGTSSVAWSPDGKWIAWSGSEGLVRILDAKTWQPVRVLLGHSASVGCVAWRRDSRWLASSSGDETVRLWQVDGTPGPVLKGHVGEVWQVAWSPDGERLASAGWNDKIVRLWHMDGTAGPVLRGHSNRVSCVAWRHDGKGLASGERAPCLPWGL